MKAKELVELAGDPRFISGIYNYCDRWCERCNFTSRCLTYEQLPESSKSDDPAASDLDNAKFWEEMIGKIEIVPARKSRRNIADTRASRNTAPAYRTGVSKCERLHSTGVR